MADVEAEGPVTGVRRRPQLDGELEALSILVEQRKVSKRAARKRAPPPLPPQSAAQKAQALVAAAKQRHLREPTDPQIHILSVYEVPPLPASARSRDAVIAVHSDWLEVMQDLPLPKASSTQRTRLSETLARAWRQLQAQWRGQHTQDAVAK